MFTYEETIRTLFAMLAQANLSDSDVIERSDWQRDNDSSYSSGYYGDLSRALVKLAGEAIVEHWAETNEIDLSLASRAW